MAGSAVALEFVAKVLQRKPKMSVGGMKQLLEKKFNKKVFTTVYVINMMEQAEKRSAKRKTLLPRPNVKADSSTDNLLRLILQLAASLFPMDKLLPGIVLAYLPRTSQGVTFENRRAIAEGKNFYASFIRYPTGVHDKLIMFTAFGVTPNEAIREIGLKLQSAQTLTADLRDALMGPLPLKYVKFSGFDLGGDLE